uniref:RWD domain-containing protein n=1 Tax=Syphacia muris TaxID=451379 RepID=A0A0N5A8K7_9BILA
MEEDLNGQLEADYELDVTGSTDASTDSSSKSSTTSEDSSGFVKLNYPNFKKYVLDLTTTANELTVPMPVVHYCCNLQSS